MLPVEVVHHLLRLLGAVRGLLGVGVELRLRYLLAEFVKVSFRALGLRLGLGIVGVELRLRYLLAEFVKVSFRALGLRLGLGIVNVKLRLAVAGGLLDVVDGSLDTVGAQSPTIGELVRCVRAHAGRFGLPDDSITSILQDLIRLLDLATAEIRALALLENLFRSVLGAAGDVLQSLLGLRALL